MLSQLRALTTDQRNAFLAAYLGWTLDAFDYFLLVFVLKDIEKQFHASAQMGASLLLATLACRPIGALLFGAAADKYGRRLPLMVNVILYSVLELASGFAPTFTSLLVLRAMFGIAMGGEWGLGASLALESAPAAVRGVLSGILQQGYPVGYLLGAVAYPLIVPHLGWRPMFFLGSLPALLTLFIRAKVKESPVWEKGQHEKEPIDIKAAIRQHGGIFVYLVILMTAFNFMSHGTQDLYPKFLQVQRKFDARTVSNIVIIFNLGALAGGIMVGSLSQKIGRRKAIVISALLAVPIIPLWAFSHSPLLLATGAFLMQFCVQGAWGVIPAHLTELSPNAFRGTFTGLAYQLGNLLASVNGNLQTKIAERHGGNYSIALASVILVVLLTVAMVTALGKESRGVRFEDASLLRS
ncbi:MAG: MFS transporter [Janthinobacterium lividum]